MSDFTVHELAGGLHPIHVRQLHQILDAACVDPARLSTQGRRILRWLAGWDGWTTGGLVEILAATRTAAQAALHQERVDAKIEALRRSEAAVDAALARYDEREERRHDRG